MLLRPVHESARDPRRFRLRGREVSRLEAFTDAIFGFALTLLVVPLEVPATLDEMLDRMKGAPAFAICFVMLVQLWYKHCMFFRRYSLSDVPTMLINSALLFVVLLYVYPMKFMFTAVLAMMTGLGPASVQSSLRSLAFSDARVLYQVFGLGFAAVFGLYALLYAHAWRRRDSLALTDLERHDTLYWIADNLGYVAVGLFSVLLSLLVPDRLMSVPGFCYFLMGPVAFFIGRTSGKRRERLAQAVVPAS